MGRRRIELTMEQREELQQVVRLDPKAYRRERAAAILKVADGMSALQVAQRGLLVRRDSDTVYGWLNRYLEHGVAGLTIAAGRGRKPTVSPPPGRPAGGHGGWTAGAAGG